MSLKILINNEEVVCNSNIQINEEMLSTSSTILKNCYPKSWENDKDYTSRYYFPKDYSKCKILTDEAIQYEIIGSTSQDGTPTPSNPVPVINKSGNIQETIGGLPYTFNLGDIELCKIGNYQDSIKKSTGTNLFSSEMELGTLSASGEPVSSSNAIRTKEYIPIEPNTQYTLKNYVDYHLYVYEYNNNEEYINKRISRGIITFTTDANTKYIKVCSNEGTSENDIDTLYMLNKGSTSLPYEPYGEVWYVEKNIGTYTINTEDITLKNYSSVDYAAFPKPTDYVGYGKYQDNPVYCNKATYLLNWTANDSTNINKINAVFSNNAWWLGFPNDTTLETMQSELENTLIYYQKSTTSYIVITDENLIEQLNSVGQRLLFCGCIKNTGNINLNPRQPHFVDLQVLDFKTLLSEGDTLNYVITGKTIVEAINQVVNSISDYGFIVGNIQILNPNDVINAYSTLNKTAYDVFQYIADITQSRWTTRMIDENTIAIDFYDPTLMPTASPIQSTQTYYKNNKIIDISFNYSTNDYRNKQIMTSDEIIANITQTNTIVADGYATTFTCENKIGTITNMKVNGVNATFITKSEEELGLTATFVYQPGENNFESSSTLLAGSIITITYYPIVKGREIILNSGESTRINEQINRNGNISRYENRQDATSSAELQKIGQSYIKYKGKAEINLKVKSEIDLFNVGQIVEYQAPLEELATDYMVKSKTIDWYVVPDNTYYTYELTSNFNYENAVNYFDNQRAKNQGNIGEGQTITRNIDLEATALIKFYDTEVNEIEVLNPTSLDFALDGVLI